MRFEVRRREATVSAWSFNCQRPYMTFQVNLYKGLSCKWNYCGCDGEAPYAIPGRVPIASQDFDGSLATFAVCHAF